MKMRIWRIVKNIFKIIIVVLVLIPLCGIMWIVSCLTYDEIYRPSVKNVFDEMYIAAKEPKELSAKSSWGYKIPSGSQALLELSQNSFIFYFDEEALAHCRQEMPLPKTLELCLIEMDSTEKILSFHLHWKEYGEYEKALRSIFVTAIYSCTKKTLTYEIKYYLLQPGVEGWVQQDTENLESYMSVILSDWFFYMSEDSKFSMENPGAYEKEYSIKEIIEYQYD